MSQLFSLVYAWPLICIITAVVGIVKLLDCKECMFMKKRSRRIVFGLILSLISAIIAVVTLDIIIMYYNTNILFIFGATFFCISWWTVLFFVNTKNWMIHYKYHWTYYTLQLEWQQIINPNIVTEMNDNNWYIHNRKKYGNLSYIFRVFGILHTIGCIMCIFAIYIGIYHAQHIHIMMACAIIYSLSLLPAILFVAKTPSFNDTFFIHWECKMHSKILILSVFMFIMTFSVYILTQNANITSIVAVSASCLICFAMVYVSTFMIINKNRNKSKPQLSRPSLARSISSLSGGSNRKNRNRSDVLRVKDIFSNKQALNLFMTHLSKEYSTECLLCYIEFSQFQQYAMDQMTEYERNHEALSKIIFFEIATNVPLSVIVETAIDDETEYTENDYLLMSVKQRAYKLYMKYVKIGGLLEINISGTMRNQLSAVFDRWEVLKTADIDLKDLMLLFEAPREEMMTLLEFSFNRFMKSDEFVEVKKLMSLSPINRVSIRIQSITNKEKSPSPRIRKTGIKTETVSVYRPQLTLNAISTPITQESGSMDGIYLDEMNNV